MASVLVLSVPHVNFTLKLQHYLAGYGDRQGDRNTEALQLEGYPSKTHSHLLSNQSYW